ncbi:MAG: hypothetical protein ABIG63_16020, partial [Chloroflexota bacterium]
GMERNILVPVCFGGAEPPLAFRLIQTAPLDGWPENSKHPGYLMFLRSIHVNTGHSAKYTTQTSVSPRHQKTQEISWGKILLISIALIVMIFSIVTTLDKFTTSRELGIGDGNPSLNIDTPALPPTLESTTTPTSKSPTPSPRVIIETEESTPNTTIPHYLDSSLWFPIEADVNQGLITTEIERVTEVTNLPEWGRLDTFVRSFNHPHLCGSSDLHRVFIQITFFETQTGAEAFYHWAHEGADVQFKDYVGDNAYIYKELDAQRFEEECRVDYYSLSFQRANVFTRVRVQAIPGKLSFDEMREIAKSLAILIDQHYLNYLEQ